MQRSGFRRSATSRPRPRRAGSPRSQAEAVLTRQIEWAGLPPPEREYRFASHLGRQFRVDYAWPALKLAVEIDGGKFMVRFSRTQGRVVPVGSHNRAEDLERQNILNRLGWCVLRYDTSMVRKGLAIRELTDLLQRMPPPDAGLLEALLDLHKQATEERSHYYTGATVSRAIRELARWANGYWMVGQTGNM